MAVDGHVCVREVSSLYVNRGRNCRISSAEAHRFVFRVPVYSLVVYSEDPAFHVWYQTEQSFSKSFKVGESHASWEECPTR